MRILRALAVILFVVVSLPAGAAPSAPAPPLGDARVRMDVAARALAATVQVVVPTRGATGSGIAIGRREVLTASHVVEDPSDAVFTALFVVDHQGRRIPARLVGRDFGRDVALLRVDEPLDAWLPLGERVPRAGEPLLVVGHPRGFPRALVTPVTAAGAPMDVALRPTFRCVPFAGTVQPGNSGGAAVDLGGRIVGTVSLSFRIGGDGSVGGAGCFVSSMVIAASLDRIRREGTLTYPALGVEILGPGRNGLIVRAYRFQGGSPLPPELHGTPFEILAIDGRTGGEFVFRDALARHRVGDEIVLRVSIPGVGEREFRVQLVLRTQGFPRYL